MAFHLCSFVKSVIPPVVPGPQGGPAMPYREYPPGFVPQDMIGMPQPQVTGMPQPQGMSMPQPVIPPVVPYPQGGYSGRPGTARPGFTPVIPPRDDGHHPVIPDISRFEDEPQRQQGGPYVYQPSRSPPPQPYIPSRYSDDRTPSPIVL